MQLKYTSLLACGICALMLIAVTGTPLPLSAQNVDLPHNNLLDDGDPNTQAPDGDLLISGIEGGNTFFDMTAKPDGIWHYSSVTITSDMTVTFIRNADNTPVRWYVDGEVRIDGTLNLNGQNGNNTLDLVAQGGPGGGDGGLGGRRFDQSGSYRGFRGEGPGGGAPGLTDNAGGGNGSYNYSNSFLRPLLGGSGGGGGASSTTINGPNGGAGGGAILIDSSRDIIVNGSITAKGGNRASFFTSSGYGTGGAILLVADRVSGSGSLSVFGGANSTSFQGRSRIESYDDRTDLAVLSFGVPVENVAPSTVPSLKITEVSGVTVATSPGGDLSSPDVIFTEAGDIRVTVTTTNIPDGTEVTLSIIFNNRSELLVLPTTGQPTVVVTGGVATFTGTVPAGVGTMQAFADVPLPAPQ